MLRTVIFLSIWASLWSLAHAQGRVALVIGNSAYLHTPKLANPQNDANDISRALKGFGFLVIEGSDLGKAGMEVKLREFAKALSGGDVGLVYYAGHGLQVGGVNFLVPTDAKLDDVSSLDFELIRLDVVQRIMEREARTNILFLDACRDNPLARNLARAMGTRSTSIGRGLANVEAGGGTLISFSTQPGAVAFDGAGRNSPFAGALVRHAATPWLDLGTILIRVRRDVMDETKNRQVPWEHSALTDVFFFGPAQTVSLPGVTARLSEAAEAWDRTKNTISLVALDAFAVRYQETFYADLARARIEQLKQQERDKSIKPQPLPQANAFTCADQQSESACLALARCEWLPAGASTPIMDSTLYRMNFKRVSCQNK